MVGEEYIQDRINHFDFKRMYELLGNDKETIKKLLFYERLDDIKYTAHILVRSTSSFGLDRLYTLLKKIEQLNQFDSEVLNSYLFSLKAETNDVKKLINSYL